MENDKIIFSQLSLNEMLQAFRKEVLAYTPPQLAAASEPVNTEAVKHSSRKEVAARFGVCLLTVDKLIKDGHLRSHRVGRLVRFKESDVINCLSKLGRRVN